MNISEYSKKRLSLQTLQSRLLKRFSGWKAAFCIMSGLKKASLTVEAALTVPLFLGAFLLMFQAMDLYRLQGLLTLSLQESAMELSAQDSVLESLNESNESEDSDEESYNIGSGIPSLAVCILYARANLPDEVLEKGQVSLLASTLEGEVLTFHAVYTPKTSFSFLPVSLFSVSAGATIHFFTGRGSGDPDGETTEAVEMVYVTDYESVYHTSASCSHIALHVHAISQSSLDNAKNKSGAHYSPCAKCVGSGAASGQVYVSDYGTKYHNSATCSGLKRTVRLVPKDSVGDLPVCSKCGAALGS